MWKWLHKWTDDALAFLDGASVQFFSACHFEALREFLFQPDDPAPLLRLALQGTLGGWAEGAGSPGDRVQQYLQERYALSRNVRHEQRKLTFAANPEDGQRVFRLRVPDVGAEGGAEGGADADAAIAMLSFDELRDVLFDVSVDRSLDGFIVKRVDVGAPTVVHLEVVQIKTGRKGKQITLGGPANDRRPNDTTMRGIVAKAAHGAKAFRDSVNEVYRVAGKTAPTLEFELFTCITNKTLNEEATAEFMDDLFECEFGPGQKVPVEVLPGDDCYALMDDAARSFVEEL